MSQYYDRKLKGLCVDCSKPAMNDSVRCESCNEKQKIKSQANRDKAKKAGLCMACLKNKPEDGYSVCAKCREDWRTYYKDKIQKERERANQKRKKYKENGLCTSCGGKRDTHRLKCKKCHEKSLQSENKIRAERKKKGLCAECGKNKPIAGKVSCESCSNMRKEEHQKNKAHRNYVSQELRKRLRNEVLAAYGGKCNCCGEAEPLFLEIDHVQGGGSKQRRVIHGGVAFYYWLKEQNYPQDDYQILCRNCNFGKYRNNGVCPHQKERT